MRLCDSTVHRMLPINFNKNINKMLDFRTVQYELYESSFYIPVELLSSKQVISNVF